MAGQNTNGANSRQVGGTHYQGQSRSGQQHWDMAWDFNLDFFQYQVTKYLFRWRQKNGTQDLEKAGHFLQKYLELAKVEEHAEQADHAAAIAGAGAAARPAAPAACPYCLAVPGAGHAAHCPRTGWQAGS
jgi:hypothetical protein